jgi:hypothetical protein
MTMLLILQNKRTETHFGQFVCTIVLCVFRLEKTECPVPELVQCKCLHISLRVNEVHLFELLQKRAVLTSYGASNGN